MNNVPNLSVRDIRTPVAFPRPLPIHLAAFGSSTRDSAHVEAQVVVC